MLGRRGAFIAGVVAGLAGAVGLVWLDGVVRTPPRPWLVSSWRDKDAAIEAWERRNGLQFVGGRLPTAAADVSEDR